MHAWWRRTRRDRAGALTPAARALSDSAGLRPRSLPTPVIEGVESRVLWSADLPLWSAAVPAPLTDVAAQAVAPADPRHDLHDRTALIAQTDARPHTASQTRGDEWVFIASDLPDLDSWLADFDAQREQGRALRVALIDAASDGLQQIEQAWQHAYGPADSGTAPVSAVHLVVHGAGDGVQLGATWLTGALDQTARAALSGWRDRLNTDADVLIYGCELASAADGQQLLQTWADLTGADVAGSDDLTGQSADSGRSADWSLEWHSGPIEHGVAATPRLQAVWRGTLAVFTVTSDNPSGPGTLGNAVQQANMTAGQDVIRFAIPGTGPQVIRLPGALPIVDSLVIDGSSQSPTSTVPPIILDGFTSSNVPGIMAREGNIALRGVAIINFDQEAVSVTSTSFELSNSWIGVDPRTGQAAGNGGNGLEIGASSWSLIQNNVISANAGAGISVTSSPQFNALGNLIGVGPDRETAMSNGADGIVIAGTSAVFGFIGGTEPNEGNVIANHLAPGASAVQITDESAVVSIVGNQLYNNAAVAIDLLGSGGPAPVNDPLDTDFGPNELLNAPELSSAVYSEGLVSVGGLIRSTADVDLLIEWFASPASMGASSAFVQLGSQIVHTNADGFASFQTQLIAPLNPGDQITATATLSQMQGQNRVYMATSPMSAPFTVAMPETGSWLVVNTLQERQDGDVSSVSALLANPGADGVISLPEAVHATNNTPGLDQVLFNLPGLPIGEAYTLQFSAPLPAISSPLQLDARSQPNRSGLSHPLVLLNGLSAGTGADGLRFVDGSDGSSLLGLVIGGFIGDGVVLDTGADAITLQGNWIGTSVHGDVPLSNDGVGVRVRADSSLIGGTNESARNLISGNAIGVLITGQNNRVQGNYIGLNSVGDASIPNLSSGVALRAGARGNVVGGDVGGAGNVISGNNEDGVLLADAGTTANLVQGNLIGVDIGGTASVGNQRAGVAVTQGASGNQIGGADAAANVLSGNGGYGVVIADAGTENNQLLNNLIGLSASGRAVSGNGIDQILIQTSAAMGSNQIGRPGLGNHIAADQGAGIRISGPVRGTLIEANRFGIGTDQVPLGALQSGVFLASGVTETVIGGTTVDQGNLMTNVTDGVVMASGVSRNLVRMNQMMGVRALAIDLGNDGRTANDRWDEDTGPNTALNFPVLMQARAGSDGLTVDGVVYGAPGDVLTVDVYADTSRAPLRGQGRTYLGSSSVTVNEQGYARFTTTLSVSVNEGQWLTATANLAESGTSEFSPTVAVLDAQNAPPVITLPETQFVDVDGSLGFRPEANNRIQIADPDQAGGEVLLTLRAQQGTLSTFPVLRDNQSGVGVTVSDRLLEPRIAVAPDGSTVVVWSDALQNGDDNIYMQRLGPDGRALFEPVIVNTYLSANQDSPALAMAADGSFVIVWSSENQDGAGGRAVIGQRFLADGRPLGDEFQVNTTTAGNQDDPSIAMHPTGSFVVAWAGDPDPEGVGGIVLQAFDANGLRVGGEVAANSSVDGLLVQPRVSINAQTGNLVVVWTNEFGDANGNQIQLQAFDAQLQPLGGQVAVSEVVGVDAQAPDVLFLRTDGAVVSWYDQTLNRYVMRGWQTDGSLLDATLIEPAANGFRSRMLIVPSSTVPGAVESIRQQTSPDAVIREVRSFSGQMLGEQTVLVHQNATTTWFGVAADPDGGVRFVMDAGNPIGDPMFDVFRIIDPLWLQGSGDGDTVLQIRGSVSYVQAVLDALNFTPLPGFSGQASLTVELDDLGHTGSGGALTATQTLLLNVYEPNPGVTITRNGTLTSEAGGTATMSIRLNTPPISDVVFGLQVSLPSEASLSATSLTFTSENWFRPQTVTITGVDDLVRDGATEYFVTVLPATSTDPAYQRMNPDDLALTNADNDVSHAVIVTTSADTVDGDVSDLMSLVHAPGADGRISLREAILAANQTPSTEAGSNRILFDLGLGQPLNGAMTITLNSALPDITASLIIDGSSQQGWTRRPLVQLHGGQINANDAVLDLMRVTDGDVTIRSLIFSRGPGYGLRVLPGVDSGLLEGSWIGTDSSGTLDQRNALGGVLIEGGRWTLRDNLISANTGIGVEVLTDDVLLTGNLIGLTIEGNGPLSNTGHGVVIRGDRAVVGLTGASARNVISGNSRAGLLIEGDDARVQNNFIGLDLTENDYWPNSEAGIVLRGDDALVGGYTADTANVIAGNAGAGVVVHGRGNRIAGNLIGISPNLNPYVWAGTVGIEVNGADTIIGGSEVGAGNVIGRLDNMAVRLNAASTGTIVQGNWIGVTPAGTAVMIGSVGIYVEPGTQGALIGGEPIDRTGLPPANVIMNTQSAVRLGDGAQDITILGNRMHANLGLSIDLNDDALVTPNDAGDEDSGSNQLLNFPELQSASIRQGMLTVSGLLRSEPSTTFRIEIYSVTAARAGVFGHGEADRWLGAITITTDANGLANINHQLPAGSTVIGDRVSATATVVRGPGRFGPTSEMSLNLVAEQGFLAPELLTALLQQLPEYDRSGLVLSGRSQDVPNAPISFALLDSADASLFSLDGNTGLLRFVAPPDFETPRDADRNNRYELVIGVADGRALTAVPLTVTVLDGADPALRITSLSSSSMAERDGQILVQVSLAGLPTSEVTVDLRLSDRSQASLGLSRLIFTPSSLQQTLVINSLDDTLADGDTSFQVLFEVSASSDALFDRLAMDPLQLRIRDDDARSTVRVTTLDDRLDGDVSSLRALLSDPGADGRISLREAMLAANATPNPASAQDAASRAQVSDAIVIDVPVDPQSAQREGWLEQMHRIVLTAPLPTITEAVQIDGWNRAVTTPIADALGRPDLIYLLLDGVSLPVAENPGSGIDGLVVDAAGTQLSHLRLSNFGGAGVRVRDAAGVVIDRVVFREVAEGLVGEGDRARFVGEWLDFADVQGLPIRLGGSAMQTTLAANDAGDADTGPNGLQNTPLLLRAPVDAQSNVRLTGSLTGLPMTAYLVDIYAASAQRAWGEGQRMLAQTQITTDAQGQASWSITLPGLASGQALTALARTATTDLWLAQMSPFAPVVLANRPSQLTLNAGRFDYVENAGVQGLVQAAQLSDDDSPDYSGGRLTVLLRNAVAGDEGLLLADQGLNAGMIGWSLVAGLNTVTYGGVPIATMVTTLDAVPFDHAGLARMRGVQQLEFAFNQAASVESVQALIRAIQYLNSSDDPVAGDRPMQWALDDGDSEATVLTGSTAGVVRVLPVNDSPVITPAQAALSVPEQGASWTTRISATDVDGRDALRYRLLDDLGGALTIDATTGLVQVLRPQVLDFESRSTGQIIVEVSDSGGGLSTETFEIRLVDVNETPAWALPASPTLTAGQDLRFAGSSRIGLRDPDLDSRKLEVQLTVSQGRLTLDAARRADLVNALGAGAVTGTGSAQDPLRMFGTVAQLQGALDALSFQVSAGYSGAVTLDLVTLDRGAWTWNRIDQLAETLQAAPAPEFRVAQKLALQVQQDAPISNPITPITPSGVDSGTGSGSGGSGTGSGGGTGSGAVLDTGTLTTPGSGTTSEGVKASSPTSSTSGEPSSVVNQIQQRIMPTTTTGSTASTTGALSNGTGSSAGSTRSASSGSATSSSNSQVVAAAGATQGMLAAATGGLMGSTSAVTLVDEPEIDRTGKTKMTLSSSGAVRDFSVMATAGNLHGRSVDLAGRTDSGAGQVAGAVVGMLSGFDSVGSQASSLVRNDSGSAVNRGGRSVEVVQLDVPVGSDAEQTGSESRRILLDIEATEASTVALSFGAVWWALKSGGLVSAFLAGVPALRGFDLVPMMVSDGAAVPLSEMQGDRTRQMRESLAAEDEEHAVDGLFVGH